MRDKVGRTTLVGNWLRRGSLWVGLAVGILLLLLAFRQVPISDLPPALTGIDPFLTLLALASVLATMLVKAVRWRLLFYPRHDGLRFGKVFAALLIGQMLNALLPSRLGDVSRAYLVGETEKVSKSLAFGTVVVEKALDGSVLVVLIACLVPFLPLPSWLSRSGMGIALLCALLLLALLIIARNTEGVRQLIGRLTGLLPQMAARRLLPMLEQGAESVNSLRSGGSLSPLVILSVATWGLGALTNYLALAAMHIQAPLWMSPLLLVVLQVGTAIPSSPGKLGVFHYLTLATLTYGGVDGARALSYGIVLHLLVFGPMIALGAFFVLRESLDLGWLTVTLPSVTRRGT